MRYPAPQPGGAEMSPSAPAPEPRSSTVSPSWRAATAVGTPQPSEALTAASRTSTRAPSSYRGAPNTPVSSAGLQLVAPPQQPDSDSSARAWSYDPVEAARAAAA